jgi:hypothetical protein
MVGATQYEKLMVTWGSDHFGKMISVILLSRRLILSINLIGQKDPKIDQKNIISEWVYDTATIREYILINRLSKEDSHLSMFVGIT